MSWYTRAAQRIINDADTIRAYIRVTFERLWLFGLSAIAAALYGVLGWVCFAKCGWPPAAGLALAFWPSLAGFWALLIGGIRHTVRVGE